MMRRGVALWLALGLVVIIAWPPLVDNVYYQRIGALVLLAAISALGLEHRRRLMPARFHRPRDLLRRGGLRLAGRLSR